MNDITLDDANSQDIYNLYNVLGSGSKQCSATVRDISSKWRSELSKTYQKCYHNRKSYTLVFKGQNASILLHIVELFISQYDGRDRYDGIADAIQKSSRKDK